jgi:hypothetical protein
MCIRFISFCSLVLTGAKMFAQETKGVTFERETFEFRASATAGVENFDLPFVNNSPYPVTILDVETSCSCLKVSVVQGLINPGEKGLVHCVFQAPDTLGLVQKSVILKTDRSDHPNQLAQVRIEVSGILQFVPNQISWEIGKAASEKILRITVADSAFVRVTKVECSQDVFECSLRTVHEGKEYELSVKPKNTKQPALGIFLLHTDSPVPRQKIHSVYAVISNSPTSSP